MHAALADELRAAARVLQSFAGGTALPEALAQGLPGLDPKQQRSRAAASHLAYRAVRELGRIDALIARLSQRPPPAATLALQRAALGLLLEREQPAEMATVVDQAVAAAKAERRTAAQAGFLNATLRRFVRERAALLQSVAGDDVARWNHPRWWIQALQTDYPDQWQALLTANNSRAPMILRVNRRRCTVADYVNLLHQCGLEVRACAKPAPDRTIDQGCIDQTCIDQTCIDQSWIELANPVDVRLLPHFDQGWVSVQDRAAQLAAPLLDARDGMRVLDACAAPGGKTGHLLELANCEVSALELDPARLPRVQQNLQRLQLQATLLQGDALRLHDWWDGRPFDRMLVDAPCSASGIVRRHPDIRWLRRRSDLATLAARQLQMLQALWPALQPDGKLLYVTCSVFRAEGERVIGRFLAGRSDAQFEPIEMQWSNSAEISSIGQLLPNIGPERNHDGFFFALIRKCR